MRQTDFDKLGFKEQLILIDRTGIEIDYFIPWFGKRRIAKFYSISNFFVELVLDLNTEKFISIATFRNVNFLSKYPQYLEEINREIHKEFYY